MSTDGFPFARERRDIQALARELVDCGADIVFGTSPHHLQPIMVYRGKVVIFGSGGYIDDYRSVRLKAVCTAAAAYDPCPFHMRTALLALPGRLDDHWPNLRAD